jgi:hypothetical protein
MKADFSTTDLVHIQVASRLSDLLFDELQKINIDGAPPSAQRIHLKALERAGAIQKSLRGIPGDTAASAQHTKPAFHNLPISYSVTSEVNLR